MVAGWMEHYYLRCYCSSALDPTAVQPDDLACKVGFLISKMVYQVGNFFCLSKSS